MKLIVYGLAIIFAWIQVLSWNNLGVMAQITSPYPMQPVMKGLNQTGNLTRVRRQGGGGGGGGGGGSWWRWCKYFY